MVVFVAGGAEWSRVEPSVAELDAGDASERSGRSVSLRLASTTPACDVDRALTVTHFDSCYRDRVMFSYRNYASSP